MNATVKLRLNPWHKDINALDIKRNTEVDHRK